MPTARVSQIIDDDGRHRLQFEKLDYRFSRAIHDQDGDGWCDLWCALFRFKENEEKNYFTDQDGDGLSDFEEMVLMQDPSLADPEPRHKSPGELALEAKLASERKHQQELSQAQKYAAMILEGMRTAIAAEKNSDAFIPKASLRKEKNKSLARALDRKYRAEKAILDAAQAGLPADSPRKAHRVTASGKVEYVRGRSYSSEMIHVDDLWPGGIAGYGDLTGADPNFLETGLGPLPPIGVWEAGGGVDPALNPGLSGRIFEGDSGDTFTAEGLDFNDSHAIEVANILALADTGDGVTGMAWDAKLKIYSSQNDYAEMLDAAADGMTFSNHSYGPQAGWRDGDSFWLGPIEPNGANYDLGPTSPIYEDPEHGAYTYDAKIQDHIVATAKTYLPVRAAPNGGAINGIVSTVLNPMSYYAVVDETHPGAIDFGNGGWGILISTPHALNSGLPPGDAPNPQSVDVPMFEWTNSPGVGLDTLTSESCAKNILTVGAAFSKIGGVNSPLEMAIRHFSSRGPTDDGRIKPDLVASSTFDVPSGSSLDLGGTSQAAAAITGTLVLLQELNHDGRGPSNYLASTWKGLLLNTAIDGTKLDHLQRTDDDTLETPPLFERVPGLLGPTIDALDFVGPDPFYGWGMANARAAGDLMLANLRSRSDRCHIGEYLLYDPTDNDIDSDNTVIEIPFQHDGQSPRMKIMICWSDPAYQSAPEEKLTEGVTDPELGPYDGATKRLVNDLNLWVVDPLGVTHRPWVLNADPLIPAGTGINSRDNVEQVIIETPMNGEYTLKVGHVGRLYATEIVNPSQDPLASESLDKDYRLESGREQGFSLIVSGNLVTSFPLHKIVDFVRVAPNNDICLSFEGFVGLRYQVESSPDLVTWTHLGDPLDLTSPNGTILTPDPSDPVNGNGKIFFRLRELSPTDN